MRLLAVDDDPAILDLLPIIFRQARLPQITVAGSGPAALSILAERDTLFDALLLDIEMPGMTGIELCQRVRQTPEYRTTPVLMLTAATDDTRIEHAFAAGADDYITKPFEVKDIVTRVRVAERFADRAQHIPLLDPDCRAPEAEEGLHGFKVGAPVRLGRAPQVISPNALGNYLSQLARHRLDSCTI
ncbi:MAG: response regulator, partial [Pseudomonadota bacterium]